MLPATSSLEEIILTVNSPLAYRYSGIPHSGKIISIIATGFPVGVQFLHLFHKDIDISFFCKAFQYIWFKFINGIVLIPSAPLLDLNQFLFQTSLKKLNSKNNKRV